MPTDQRVALPRLQDNVFLTVVDNAPLISIDLILRHQNKVLLGKRKNRPAKDSWFVPGGRILKNEGFSEAFTRIAYNELGENADLSSATFLGLFQHFYDDCFNGTSTSTHYIVAAFRIDKASAPNQLPDEQHSDYSWFDEATIPGNPLVHENTRAYFRHAANIQILQP